MNCKNCRQNCAWAGKERSEHGKCFVGYIPTTNGDRVRAMSDEEIASFFYKDCPPWCTPENEMCRFITLEDSYCDVCMLTWLREEVDD